MTAGGHKKFLFETDFTPDTDPKAHLEQKLQEELEAELAQNPKKRSKSRKSLFLHSAKKKCSSPATKAIKPDIPKPLTT